MSKKAKTADERLSDRLARIGDEAEAGEGDPEFQISEPIPEHVKVTRGNARSKVLQVRLNPDEYAAIERIAKGRRLPASTVAREAMLKLVAEDAQNPLVALVALADRIKVTAGDIAFGKMPGNIEEAAAAQANTNTPTPRKVFVIDDPMLLMSVMDELRESS